MLFPLSVSATDICPAGYYPAEYVELEYIESTGTQYIDSLFYPNQDSGMEIKFSFPTKYDINRDSWISASSSGSDIDSFGLTAWNSFAMQYNGYSLFNQHCVPNIEYVYIQNKNIGILNNVSVQRSYIQFSSSRSLTIFAYNRNDSFLKPPNLSILRVYYHKIKDNDNLVRNFIPVRRVSDGAVGMFDKVNNKFYGNNGTGEFIAGPEVQSFIIDENGDITCISCPANTYKPNSGNERCTECPENTFSPIGSKELSDCAKILRVKDYVVYMPLGKRTEHGLCVMSDGKKYCADVYERQ